MKSIFFIIFSLWLQRSFAQTLTHVGVRYEDHFGEWMLHTDMDDEEGSLEATWYRQNNWTNWNFGIRNKNGTIRSVWQDRLDEWELRGEGKTITMRQIWKNDASEWRINDGNITLDFKMKHRNDPYEWLMEDKTHGVFYVVTDHPEDPRDWTIQDDTHVTISFPMRLAMLFVALHIAAPQY